MNFTPFGSPFSTSIPNLHQFAAKFSQENVAVAENSSRYTANGIPSFTHHHHASTSQNAQPGTTTTSNSKYNSYLNAQSLYGTTNSLDKLVLSTAVDKLTGISTNSLGTSNNSSTFSTNKNCFGSSNGSTSATTSINRNHPGTVTNSPASFVLNKNSKLNYVEQHHSELTQELCNALLQTQQEKSGIKLLEDARLNPTLLNNQNQPQSSQSNSPWQSIASSSSTVADYLSQLPASTLPLSLHHFLKYSAENLSKKETQNGNEISSTHSGLLLNSTNSISNIFNLSNNNSNPNFSQNSQNSLTTINTSQLSEPHVEESNGIRKKRKKRIEKEKKPKLKPGEIRLTTALDGSTLYCCPECHMAYPEKDLLEQHLLGHTMERRFVCDICGAGLKRKDHLTRHKQSHNPERPYICSVCLKAFKRKEQLTLHFVIHSGEKRHVCQECGKGFYRKDHLRKHTRSHIARRVKAELTQQGTTLPSLSTVSASNLMT